MSWTGWAVVLAAVAVASALFGVGIGIRKERDRMERWERVNIPTEAERTGRGIRLRTIRLRR